MIQRPITGKDYKADGRNSFFHVIIVSFIWHRILSNATQMAFHWLSNIQFVALLLFIQFENLTAKPQDLLSMFLHKFSKVIGSIDLLNISQDNVAIMTIVGIWLYSFLLVSTVLLIIIKFMLKKELNQNNQKFLALVSQFHLNVGFGLSITILSQFIYKEDHQIRSEILDEAYFKVSHILLMIVNYFMGLIFALLSFNVIPSEDLLVVRNPISQVLLFLLKALAIPIVASHTQKDFLIWLLIIISLILLIVRYYHILDTFHYLHYSSMNVSLDFSLAAIIVCITNIVAKIKLDTGKPVQALSTTYIQILLLALALKLSKANINRVLESALKNDGNAIKSETDMIKRVFGLSRLAREAKAPIDDANKRSIFELHLKSILSSEFANNREFCESEMAKGYNKQIAPVLSSMFIHALSNIRLSSNMKLVFTYFLISQNRNLSKALTYLLEASNSKNFNYIMATHLILLLKQKFEEERKDEKNSILDLKTFLDFEARAVRFTEKIHSNCGRYIDFWKTYSTTRFEMMDLLSKSKEIENSDLRIKKAWDKGTKKYPEFANSLINTYSVYLRLIRNAPFTAYKLEKQFCFSHHLWRDKISDIEGALEQKNLEAPNNIVVDISLNKKSFGKITYITPNVADYLGWTQKDLIGRNINTLMLPTTRERFSYQEVVDDSGQSAVFKLKTKVETFVQTKQGYARSVTCYTDIHPHLGGELTYLMILRVKISDEQSIIINTLGEVEGITSDLASYLRMPMSQQRISISDFCSNAFDLNLIGGNKEQLSTAKSLIETQKSLESPEEVEFELFQWTKDGTKVSSHLKTFKAVLRYLPIAKTFVKIVSFDIKKDLITGTLVNSDACYSVKIEKDKKDYEIEIEAEEEEEIDEDSANFQTPPELTSQGPEKFRLMAGDMRTNLLDTVFTTALNSPLVSPSHSEMKNFVKKVKATRYSTRDQFEEKEEEDQKKKEFLGVTQLDADIVASSSHGLVNAQNRMEKAIYLFPQARRRNVLRILALIYCVTCGALLIGFEIKYTDTNSTLAANTIIMSNSTRRLEKLMEVDMFALRILAIANEFAPKTNFGLYELQYKTLALEWIKKVAGEVKSYNQALRESVYKINSEFQERFFDKITVVERENTQSLYSTRGMNSFDLMDEIIAAVDGYYGSATIDNLNVNSTDLQFILENSRSNILASGETITNIVLEDNDMKMNDTFLLLKIFTVVAGVFAILMILFLIVCIHKFRKNRDRFINIFLRIHDPNIRNNMFKAQIFRERLQRSNMDGRKAKIIASESETKNNIEILATQSFRRRDAKETGLNKKLVLLIMLAVVINIILFSGFIWALPVVHSHNQSTKATIERIVESDTASFQSVFLVTQTYNFILQNGTGKIRDLSLTEQYDLTLETLGDTQTQFIDLAQELANKDQNSEIYALLKGNECELITALISLASDNCKASLNGVLEKGLLQASNFFVSGLKNVKETFENSPRAYSDVSEAINNSDFVGIEPFLFSYWIYAYGDISDLFREQLTTDANKFSEKVGVLMIIWGVINIVFGVLSWFKIENIFQKEEEDWRKVIRSVPINTIWRNKMLKSYLFNNKHNEL